MFNVKQCQITAVMSDSFCRSTSSFLSEDMEPYIPSNSLHLAPHCGALIHKASNHQLSILDAVLVGLQVLNISTILQFYTCFFGVICCCARSLCWSKMLRFILCQRVQQKTSRCVASLQTNQPVPLRERPRNHSHQCHWAMTVRTRSRNSHATIR